MLTILICIIAGAGAGLSTGFAGLSAAVFITPVLVTLLGIPVYEAVGVSLASDVLASAISAYTYSKEGNIDLKRGRTLLILVLVFAVIGSLIAFAVTKIEIGGSQVGDSLLSYWSVLASLLLGIHFLINPYSKEQREKDPDTGRRKAMARLCGVYIGFLCGFQGTGGGMMLLFTLTAVMLFDFKKAVGTSVFIMAFTALIGAVAHFLINGMPDPVLLVTCMISTTFFARMGAVIANRISPVTLKRITGAMLAVSAFFMLLLKMQS